MKKKLTLVKIRKEQIQLIRQNQLDSKRMAQLAHARRVLAQVQLGLFSENRTIESPAKGFVFV